jgi:hypothetical protein
MAQTGEEDKCVGFDNLSYYFSVNYRNKLE